MEQEKIIQLIKSKSLIDEIKRLDHKFTDLQLIRIVCDHAKSYEQKLQLLAEIAATTQVEKAKKLAEKEIKYRKDSMAFFLLPTIDGVYELHIQDHPNAYDERYLCKTFEGALRVFHAYHTQYDSEAREDGRYCIQYRKLVDSNTGENFSEDAMGICDLTKDCEVLDVGVNLMKEDCDCSCEECEDICLWSVSSGYPIFLNRYDVVQYSYPMQEESLGIFLESEPDDEAVILPLESVYTRFGHYENVYDSHEHVPLPFVEKIDKNELSDVMKKRYDAITARMLQYDKR